MYFLQCRLFPVFFFILNGAKASAMLLQILTPVLMIIAVSCVFISGKIKNRIIIYCMSAAYIVVNLIKIAQNIANKGYSTNMLGMPEFIILFARVLLAGLIVNQTISEYQKFEKWYELKIWMDIWIENFILLDFFLRVFYNWFIRGHLKAVIRRLLNAETKTVGIAGKSKRARRGCKPGISSAVLNITSKQQSERDMISVFSRNWRISSVTGKVYKMYT